MSTKIAPTYVADIKRLTEILGRSSKVRARDTSEEPEADRLAYSLIELRESLPRVQQLLDQLSEDTLDAERVEDLLHELGEQFRHVLYHIGDPHYFRYLLEDRRT